MRRAVVIAATLALAACSPEFDPASQIEKLRVVAIRAEPPELDAIADPAAVATLTSLVLRPDFATTTAPVTTVVHLACVPVPGDPAPVPCVALQNLRDPAVAIAAGARQACAASLEPHGASTGWPAIDLAGFESCVDGVCTPASVGGVPLPPARIRVPAGFAFPPSGPERILGVQAVDLAFAVAATPDELVAGVGTTCPAADVADNLAVLWAGREHVLSTKRVVLRGPDSPNPANRNPSVAGIRAGAAVLDPTAATTVVAGEILLAPEAAGTPELYTELDAAGVPIQTVPEEWVYSWFSTAGELEDLHTRSATATDKWTVRSAGPARVVVVVRDLRGGTAWAVRDVNVAP